MTNAKVLEINCKRSSAPGNPTWATRKAKLLAIIKNITGGVPSVVMTNECTKEQQAYLATGLGFSAYGNDPDIEFDNVAVLWNAATWDQVEEYYIKAEAKGGDRYLRAVKLQHKVDTAVAPVWFASTHLTSGADYAALRRNEALQFVHQMEADAIDMRRMVISADWNDIPQYPLTGVRKTLHPWFRGQRDILPNSKITGETWNTHHGFKATRFEKKWLDDILLGRDITARYCNVVKTNPAPASLAGTDHHGVLAGISFL